jgi:hypothetical protein
MALSLFEIVIIFLKAKRTTVDIDRLVGKPLSCARHSLSRWLFGNRTARGSRILNPAHPE